MSDLPRFHTRFTETMVEVATDRLTFRLGDGVLRSVEEYVTSLYGTARKVRVLLLDEAAWVSEAQGALPALSIAAA